MKIRKFLRITHRDLGYIFFGLSIIYAVSGISLNHIDDWNPNYIVQTQTIHSSLTQRESISTEKVMSFLDSIQMKQHYKKHYYPKPTTLKIFIKNGSILVNTNTGEAFLETIRRRPVFYEFNYLHYNHAKKLWMLFSDAYAIALFWLAVSGLFLIKGKKGITGRGAWLTALGIIIPTVLYLLYI